MNEDRDAVFNDAACAKWVLRWAEAEYNEALEVVSKFHYDNVAREAARMEWEKDREHDYCGPFSNNPYVRTDFDVKAEESARFKLARHRKVYEFVRNRICDMVADVP